MRDYPNILSNSLEKDKNFNSEVQETITKIFNEKKESFFKSDNFDVKVIDVNEEFRYIAINDLKHGKMSVYSENIYSWNKDEPFKYSISSLKEKGEVYASDRVISFKAKSSHPDSKFGAFLEKMKNIDLKSLGISAEEMVETLMSAKRMAHFAEPDYVTTSSPYAMKNFCSFFGVERDDEFWIKNSEGLNQIVQKKVGEILLSVAYMFDVAEKNKFTSDKKYEFNDLDNHLWRQEKGIVLDDQNVGFYCVMTSDKDLTVYSYTKENSNYKSATSVSQLLNEIKEGSDKLIDHVALKIENGNVTFVDNCLVYCLELDIKYTKNSLIGDGYGEPVYPVDIKSYEYQLAYFQKHYGMDEFSFLNHALLTLGSGFRYDNENGRFYSDSIDYDPTVVGFKSKENIEKAEQIYGYPVALKKLDSDWTLAVERLVEKLKKDRPLPIVCDTEDEKEQKLDEIISQYENFLSKAKKNPKNKV